MTTNERVQPVDPIVATLLRGMAKLVLNTLPADSSVEVGGTIREGDAAAGDLAGAYPGPQVTGIQGRRVSDAPPEDRQVLAWVGASQQWRPQAPSTAPNSAEPSPDAGFQIVGAGFFAADGSPNGPVYNDLTIRPIDSAQGHFGVYFRGYERPSERHPFTYVVRGIAAGKGGGLPGIVEFVEFSNSQLRIRVVDSGGRRFEGGLMVEVSRVDFVRHL
jgi:hypothetical protein